MIPGAFLLEAQLNRKNNQQKQKWEEARKGKIQIPGNSACYVAFRRAADNRKTKKIMLQTRTKEEDRRIS